MANENPTLENLIRSFLSSIGSSDCEKLARKLFATDHHYTCYRADKDIEHTNGVDEHVERVLEIANANSSIKGEVINFFQSGDNVALEWEFSGYNDKDGKWSARICAIGKVNEYGQIASARDYVYE